MKSKKNNDIIAVGKRKTSIAKATLKHPGKGIIRINSKDLDCYAPELAKLKIMEPLILSGDKYKSVNIYVKVKGGGWRSQSEAIRMAIANALVKKFGESLRKVYLEYDRHLLIADTRRTEPQKPYRSAARAKRQTSKR